MRPKRTQETSEMVAAKRLYVEQNKNACEIEKETGNKGGTIQSWIRCKHWKVERILFVGGKK